MSEEGVLQEYRTGHKLSSQKSGRYCYYCNTFLGEEEETVCKKRSGKGSVSSESVGGLLLKLKHLQIVSKTAWVWV